MTTCWTTQDIFPGSCLYLSVCLSLYLSVSLSRSSCLTVVCMWRHLFFFFYSWYYDTWYQARRSRWLAIAKMLPFFFFNYKEEALVERWEKMSHWTSAQRLQMVTLLLFCCRCVKPGIWQRCSDVGSIDRWDVLIRVHRRWREWVRQQWVHLIVRLSDSIR